MEPTVYVRLVSWVQSSDNPSVDLHISLEEEVEAGSATTTPHPTQNLPKKLKITADGKVLTIASTTSVLAQWVLFDTVLPDVTWETTSPEKVTITITKTSTDVWKSCLRTPLAHAFVGLVQEEELNTLLQKEVRTLGKFKKANATDVLTEEDADAILDNVLELEPNSNENAEEKDESMKSLEAREQVLLESELMEVQQRHESLVKEEVDAKAIGDEAAAAIASRKITILKKMIALCERIQELRQGPVTISSMLEVLTCDLRKAKLNRGEEEQEREVYQDDAEKLMSADTLYVQGIRLLDARKGLEGLHYLRLAALQHGHPQAVMTLVRLYMEAGEQPRSLSILLEKAMKGDANAEEEILEPLANFTTAQMFDNGVSFFRPCVALALYFYQRAASVGESTAMMYAGQLFLRGGCILSKGREDLTDVKRGLAWLQEAVSRGNLLAYKTLLELHLEGRSLQSNYEIAKALYSNLYECAREYLRQIPDVEVRLEALRVKSTSGQHVNNNNTSSSSSSNKTASSRKGTKNNQEPEDEDEVVELHPSSALHSAAAGVGKINSAAQRFANMEQGVSGSSGSAVAGSTFAVVPASTFNPTSSPEYLARGEISRKRYERLTSFFLSVSSIYVLAFPLRVLFVPHFYTAVDWVLTFARGKVSGGKKSSGLL